KLRRWGTWMKASYAEWSNWIEREERGLDDMYRRTGGRTRRPKAAVYAPNRHCGRPSFSCLPRTRLYRRLHESPRPSASWSEGADRWTKRLYSSSALSLV